MKLSILIPTMENRSSFLARLLAILEPQLTAEVEIVIEPGPGSIGAKRNTLIARAAGDYVVFIDDDDRVMPDYVVELLAGIAKGVDVVSIRSIRTENGERPQEVIDLPYQPHSGVIGSGVFLRGTQHIDAVKRELAQAVPFADKSFGEDLEWTRAIETAGIIKTWHQIDHPTYLYEFRFPK